MNDPRARRPRVRALSRHAQQRTTPLLIFTLFALLALLLASCSSPTPSRPGAALDGDAPGEVDGGDGEELGGGGSPPMDFGRATQVPPGGGEEFIRRTVVAPPTLDPDAPYPPPPVDAVPTSAYPSPDEGGESDATEAEDG